MFAGGLCRPCNTFAIDWHEVPGERADGLFGGRIMAQHWQHDRSVAPFD